MRFVSAMHKSEDFVRTAPFASSCLLLHQPPLNPLLQLPQSLLALEVISFLISKWHTNNGKALDRMSTERKSRCPWKVQFRLLVTKKWIGPTHPCKLPRKARPREVPRKAHPGKVPGRMCKTEGLDQTGLPPFLSLKSSTNGLRNRITKKMRHLGASPEQRSALVYHCA